MDNEQKNEQIEVNELDVCKKQSEEYLNNWKRERADFINYKKDEIKRLGEIIKFANEGVILDSIEIMDDLDIAIKHNLNDGVIQVRKKFMDLFTKYGVEKINTSGTFDPSEHEAVEGTEGDKLEEVRAGYKMNDKIIRPARVRIIK